jgi:hypothetical protein
MECHMHQEIQVAQDVKEVKRVIVIRQLKLETSVGQMQICVCQLQRKALRLTPLQVVQGHEPLARKLAE